MLDFFLHLLFVLATMLTMVSYVLIVVAVLNIPSSSGPQKTSSCASLLTVVLLGYGRPSSSM